MLAYLSRYTHRVAISNRRLTTLDDADVTFRFKDYRRDGADRNATMTLRVNDFIRRFLLHVLPKGFQRIGRYGLLASVGRKGQCREAPETCSRRHRPQRVQSRSRRTIHGHAAPAAAAV